MTSTHPMDTGYLLVVRVNRDTHLYTLVPTFNFPSGADLSDDRGVSTFVDDTFDVTATIAVHRTNGEYLGDLTAGVDTCPLCHDRQIFVYRRNLTHLQPYANEQLAIALTEGTEAAKRYIVTDDDTKPCPACRPTDYLLSLNDQTSDHEEDW